MYVRAFEKKYKIQTNIDNIIDCNIQTVNHESVNKLICGENAKKKHKTCRVDKLTPACKQVYMLKDFYFVYFVFTSEK